MHLEDVLRDYFARNLRITDDQTRRKYRYAIQALAATIGREPTLGDLSDDTLTQMMVRLRDKGLSPATVNDRRSRICALWTWAARRGLTQQWPTVQPMRVPRRAPVAWTIEEMQRLFDACIAQRGSIGEIPACLWWSTLVSLMWDSGERVTALLRAEWSHVADGWLSIPAECRKAKSDDRTYKLGEQSLQLLNMIALPARTLILPWPLHPLYVWKRFGQVLRDAGLPSDRRRKFHAIRRSVASHVHAAGGNSSEMMGHSSPDVTRTFYLDPRLTQQKHPVDYLPRLARHNPRPPNDPRRRA